MYLFTRTGQLAPHTGALEWARSIGKAAGDAMGNPTALYARVFSPGFGTVSWTSVWPDLATFESRSAALMSDAAFMKLQSEGGSHMQGPLDDAIGMIVNGDPTATEAPALVWTVSSVAANGRIGDALAAGVEIASFAEAATGRHASLVAHQTGTFGALSWVTGFESLAAFEVDVTKLWADPGWVALLDRVGPSYTTNPAFGGSSLWQRL